MTIEFMILTVKQDEMFRQIANAGDTGWYIGSCKANAGATRIANDLERKDIVWSERYLLGRVYRVKTEKDAQS